MANRSGTTLIEVIVCVAIIAALTAILAPVLRGAKKESLRTTAAAQLKQLHLGATIYAADWDSATVGSGPEMGFPGPDVPLNLVWPNQALWRSPCGVRPDYADAFVYFTYEFSPYDSRWKAYVEKHGESAVLIRDVQCDDRSHSLRNRFAVHSVLGVRLDGSVWRCVQKGDPMDLLFWSTSEEK
jgi:prepilin-type N-terminal cleavage/methylation domain-containing protein